MVDYMTGATMLLWCVLKKFSEECTNGWKGISVLTLKSYEVKRSSVKSANGVFSGKVRRDNQIWWKR